MSVITIASFIITGSSIYENLLKKLVASQADYRINTKQNDKSTAAEHFSVAYYCGIKYHLVMMSIDLSQTVHLTH